MKKLLSVLVLATVALSAQANEEKMPTECKAYFDAVEQLAKKNPAMAQQMKESLEASKGQWGNLNEEQEKAANDSCKQAHEQIKPML